MHVYFMIDFHFVNNHIKLIISFNLRLKDFSSIFKFFISIFMLKISIFRLCIIILCHFSSFLMLLTLKTCSHIALCASKVSVIYFFKIIKTILFFFCILATVRTKRSIFAFFNVLFIEFCIFIVFKVQLSFLRVMISLFLQYNTSCDFDTVFLIIRFHLFTFMFANEAAFCVYVDFCIELCKICKICEIYVVCNICKFSAICLKFVVLSMF